MGARVYSGYGLLRLDVAVSLSELVAQVPSMGAEVDGVQYGLQVEGYPHQPPGALSQ